MAIRVKEKGQYIKKEGKKQQSIMFTKKAKHDSKYVRKVSETRIEPLLEWLKNVINVRERFK